MLEEYLIPPVQKKSSNFLWLNVEGFDHMLHQKAFNSTNHLDIDAEVQKSGHP